MTSFAIQITKQTYFNQLLNTCSILRKFQKVGSRLLGCSSDINGNQRCDTFNCQIQVFPDIQCTDIIRHIASPAAGQIRNSDWIANMPAAGPLLNTCTSLNIHQCK